MLYGGGGGDGDEELEDEDSDDTEEASDVAEIVDLGGCALGSSSSSSPSSTTIFPFSVPFSLSSSVSLAMVASSAVVREPTRALLVPASLPYSSPSSGPGKLALSSKFLFGDRVLRGNVLGSSCAYNEGYGMGEGESEDSAEREGVGDVERELGSGMVSGSDSSLGEAAIVDGGLEEEGVGGPNLSLIRFTLCFCRCFDGGEEGVVTSIGVGVGVSWTQGSPP